MIIAFTIKQGATFDFTVQYTDSNSSPLPLTGVTLTSQVRNKGSFVDTFTITILDELAGTYRVTAPLGTLDWPVGVMYWDIREFSSGSYKLTQTIAFNVERGITQL